MRTGGASAPGRRNQLGWKQKGGCRERRHGPRGRGGSWSKRCSRLCSFSAGPSAQPGSGGQGLRLLPSWALRGAHLYWREGGLFPWGGCCCCLGHLPPLPVVGGLPWVGAQQREVMMGINQPWPGCISQGAIRLGIPSPLRAGAKGPAGAAAPGAVSF